MCVCVCYVVCVVDAEDADKVNAAQRLTLGIQLTLGVLGWQMLVIHLRSVAPAMPITAGGADNADQHLQ